MTTTTIDTKTAVSGRFDIRLAPAALAAAATARTLAPAQASQNLATTVTITAAIAALGLLFCTGPNLHFRRRTTDREEAEYDVDTENIAESGSSSTNLVALGRIRRSRIGRGRAGRGVVGQIVAHVCLVAWAVVLVAAPCAVTKHHSNHAMVQQVVDDGRFVTFEATITSHPKHQARSYGDSQTAFLATIHHLTATTSASAPCETRRIDTHVVVLATTSADVALRADPSERGPLMGQRWIFRGKLAANDYPGRHDAQVAISSGELVDAGPWWLRASSHQRRMLSELVVHDSPRSALVPGLLIGDTSGLTVEQNAQVKATGLTHLVAVSGGNMVVVATLMMLLCVVLGVPRRLRYVISAAAVVSYALLVGPDSSVLRAVVMSLIALMAIAAGRSRAALTALYVAVIGLLAWNPKFSYDYGFLLSVAATLALVLCLQQVVGRWDHLAGRAVVAFCATPVLATLACTPIILTLNGEIATYSIPANLLASWTAPLAMASGSLALLAMNVEPTVAQILLEPVRWASTWILVVAERLARWPGATVTVGSGAVACALCALVCWGALAAILWWQRPGNRSSPDVVERLRNHGRALSRGVAVVVAVVASVLAIGRGTGLTDPAQRHDWLVYACDVGQGTATLIRTGPSQAILADTGGPGEGLARCLKRAGITEVPLVVLSHYHLDHVGALPEVLAEVRVAEVWATGYLQPSTNAALVQRWLSEAGLRATVPTKGTRHTTGHATVTVVGDQHEKTWTGGFDSTGGVDAVAGVEATGSEINNASLAVTVTTQGLTVFLPGDAEISAQQALVDEPMVAGVDLLRADVLSVPHHGSAKQLPELFERVRPQVAVVSAGRQNDYGHPARRALMMLARSGTPVRRTDQCGHLSIGSQPDRASVWVQSARGPC